MSVLERSNAAFQDLTVEERVAAIAVIDTAKSTNHLMTHLGPSSLRAGSLRRARSYLGEEGRRITRFTLPVCEDPNQIAFHAVASDVVPAHVMCALVHGDAGHQLKHLVLAHALVRLGGGLINVVRAVAHQVLLPAVAAGADCHAGFFIGLQRKSPASAIAFGRGKSDGLMAIRNAVAAQLGLGVAGRRPVPELALLRQCH